MVAVDLPGHAGSDEVRADLADHGRSGGGGSARRARWDRALCACSATRSGHGSACTSHWVRTCRSRQLVFIGVTAGIEDPGQRAERRLADEALADALEDVRRCGSIRRSLAQRADVQPASPRQVRPIGANACATLRQGWPRACASAERGPRSPLVGSPGHSDPRPSSRWPAPTTSASLGTRCAWPASPPTGVASLVPGGGHAAHLAQPAQTSASGAPLAACGPHRLISRHRSTPRASSTPPTIWSRAVSPSMGRSSRPRLSLRARRTGAMASGMAARAMRAQTS